MKWIVTYLLLNPAAPADTVRVRKEFSEAKQALDCARLARADSMRAAKAFGGRVAPAWVWVWVGRVN